MTHFYLYLYQACPSQAVLRALPCEVQAASAAKTLVLLLDMSSMNLRGRWELTIAAAKSVISNLAFSDMFGVVLFSTANSRNPRHFNIIEGGRVYQALHILYYVESKSVLDALCSV